MFLEAYQLFKHEKYLNAAISCGECIWHRGLVLLGNGLCSGITGNIYGLLNLYEFTKELKWKVRAY